MMQESMIAGAVVIVVCLAAYLIARRFFVQGAPEVPSEEATSAVVFRSFEQGQVDRDGRHLCRIKGCGKAATEAPLAISTYERDRYFGEQNRLHGRPPRYHVVSLETTCEHAYCTHHRDQVRERLESAIADGRARCARIAAEVFDVFTELNRGGVDREIETTGKDAEVVEKPVFTLPALGNGS